MNSNDERFDKLEMKSPVLGGLVKSGCEAGMRRSLGTALRTAVLRLAVLSLLLAAGPGFAPRAQGPQQQPKPLRVLFVGNSYTYYNNLPEMLEQMSLSAGIDPRIQARMIVAGGTTSQVDRSSMSKIADLVKDAARRISHQLGYQLATRRARAG